jgi:hypothetical protein
VAERGKNSVAESSYYHQVQGNPEDAKHHRVLGQDPLPDVGQVGVQGHDSKDQDRQGQSVAKQQAQEVAAGDDGSVVAAGQYPSCRVL